MSNRHLARAVAMQSLYERDFHGDAAAKVDDIVERDLEEFAPGLDDKGFALELTHGVLKKQKEIDSDYPDFVAAVLAAVRDVFEGLEEVGE